MEFNQASENVKAMDFLTMWLWRQRPNDAIGARMEWVGKSFDAPDAKGNIIAKHGQQIMGCRIVYGEYSAAGTRRGTELVMLGDIGWGSQQSFGGAAGGHRGDPPWKEAERAAKVAGKAAAATKPMPAPPVNTATAELDKRPFSATNPFNPSTLDQGAT